MSALRLFIEKLERENARQATDDLSYLALRFSLSKNASAIIRLLGAAETHTAVANVMGGCSDDDADCPVCATVCDFTEYVTP